MPCPAPVEPAPQAPARPQGTRFFSRHCRPGCDGRNRVEESTPTVPAQQPTPTPRPAQSPPSARGSCAVCASASRRVSAGAGWPASSSRHQNSATRPASSQRVNSSRRLSQAALISVTLASSPTTVAHWCQRRPGRRHRLAAGSGARLDQWPAPGFGVSNQLPPRCRSIPFRPVPGPAAPARSRRHRQTAPSPHGHRPAGFPSPCCNRPG